VKEASLTDEGILIADFDLAACAAARAQWGIFRDRRPDLYAALARETERVAWHVALIERARRRRYGICRGRSGGRAKAGLLRLWHYRTGTAPEGQTQVEDGDAREKVLAGPRNVCFDVSFRRGATKVARRGGGQGTHDLWCPQRKPADEKGARMPDND